MAVVNLILLFYDIDMTVGVLVFDVKELSK